MSRGELPKASHSLIVPEPEAVSCFASQPGDGPSVARGRAAAPDTSPPPLVLLKATVQDGAGRAASPLTYDREGACGLC